MAHAGEGVGNLGNGVPLPSFSQRFGPLTKSECFVETSATFGPQEESSKLRIFCGFRREGGTARMAPLFLALALFPLNNLSHELT